MSKRIQSPARLSLGRILSDLGDGNRELKIQSCCDDAAHCQPGDVYVAIDDGVMDGHESAYDAVQRGAAAIVAERHLPIPIPQFIVADTRVAFGIICHALAGWPSAHLWSIGITGTYGKTMTELLMISVLEAAGCLVGAMGSLGYCDGAESELPRGSTNVQDLAHWLARMRSQGCSHAVIEVSSESLATRQLSGIEFNAAIMTNVRHAHLEFHGNVANYRRAKEMIFTHLKPNGVAVLNADDPVCQRILSTLSCPVLTFSTRHDAEVTATVVERFRGEQTFLLHAGSDSMPIRTSIIGDHHIQNCLAVACLGLSLGIELPTIAQGLENVTSVPGRMERVECGQEFGVFVDCGSSPESLTNTMNSLREVTTGRLICVMGPTADVTSVERARTGRLLERLTDECVLTSAEMSLEPDHQEIHDMLDGFDRPAQVRLLPDRAKAICWALGEAEPGDTVVIVGGQLYAESSAKPEKTRWYDRDVARYWLLQVGSQKMSPWMAA